MQQTQMINNGRVSDKNGTESLTYSESGQILNGSNVWRLTTSANTLRGSIPFQSTTLPGSINQQAGQQHRTTITSGSSQMMHDNDSLVFSNTTGSQ